MFFKTFISIIVSLSIDFVFNYNLVLDLYLLSAILILSIAALLRAVTIKKYGRKGAEEILWARLAAWIGIACGYMLLIAHFLLR